MFFIKKMIPNGFPGRPRASYKDLDSAPFDPLRNQICPKRFPDTKIKKKNDSKTSKYYQKVIPKFQNEKKDIKHSIPKPIKKALIGLIQEPKSLSVSARSFIR